MKTIKLNYAGIVKGQFNEKANLIYDTLIRNGYDVEISDDPDYLVCDVYGDNPYEYCGTPQVRIMYTGENVIPDFNLIDYAICPYPIQFGDRSFHLPTCVWPYSRWASLPEKDRNYSLDFLKSKVYFANFISSHDSENNIRSDFFKKLCEYKRVEAPGSFLNNMPNGETVNWLNDSKTDFQRKCKFTLCFESTLHDGFVTEKIMDAFSADTIPIYYGSSAAADIFNKDAFINVADFDSFEDAIARIKELVVDDEKYLQMLRQPILVDPDYPRKLEEAREQYICHIFDQPLENAYRRSRVYYPKRFDDYLATAVGSDDMTFAFLFRRIFEKIVQKIRAFGGNAEKVHQGNMEI